MGVEPLIKVIAMWRGQQITPRQAIGKLLLLVQKQEARLEMMERSLRQLTNLVRQLEEELERTHPKARNNR